MDPLQIFPTITVGTLEPDTTERRSCGEEPGVRGRGSVSAGKSAVYGAQRRIFPAPDGPAPVYAPASVEITPGR